MSLHLNSPLPFDLDAWQQFLAALEAESPVNQEMVEFARDHVERLERAQFNTAPETAPETA